METTQLRRALRALAVASLTASVAATPAHAQDRVLQIVTTDSEPISYAFVQANGGHALLTDESGRVSMGRGKKQTFDIEVRRIGFSPFYGKVALPDTASTVRIVLTRLAQQLNALQVTSRKSQTSLELNGFYRRWLDMQKGVTSAIFIGPEEIDKRNASRVSSLLSGVNGVTMTRTNNGNTVATTGGGGSCPMAIVVDGRQICPLAGCNFVDYSRGLTDQNSVLIDQVVDLNSVAGIEVYKRGGNMPSDFHVDGECGAIALWTGSRKP
ncbi:MAG: TonB-dependent receptor plug domain-containing protein [Gemmatimonadaceae bacterium]